MPRVGLIFNTYDSEEQAAQNEYKLQKQGYITKIVKKRIRNNTCFLLRISTKIQIHIGRPKKIKLVLPTDTELRELLQEE